MAYDEKHVLTGAGLARVWSKVEENFAKKDDISVTAKYTSGDKIASIKIGENTTDIYASATSDIDIDNTTIVKNAETGKIGVPIDNSSLKINSDGKLYATSGGGTAAQSDWNETDETSEKYIANKPFKTIDNDTIVENDGVISAQFTQTQANWNETDVNAVSYIQNKPIIPSTDYVDEKITDVTNAYTSADTAIGNRITTLENGLSDVATSGDYDDLTNTPTIPSIEGLASESYVDDAVKAVTDLVPDTTTTSNLLVNKNQLDDAVNSMSKDYISSNNSDTANPFEHTTYIAKTSSSATILELGPWYKDGVSCGYVNGNNAKTDTFVPGDAKLVKGDWTIVQYDESVCYCFVHGFKYQRIKDGGATAHGTVKLPGIDPNTSKDYVEIVPITTGVAAGSLGFTDNTDETFTKIGYHPTFAITNVINPVNSIIEFDSTDLNTPKARYDLSMPTTRYVVTSEEYKDDADKWHAPLWSFQYTLSDSAFTTTQLESINSTITKTDVDKLKGIEDGAEVNVQSDWNQTDDTKDDFIKNKPTNIGIINDESESTTEVWSASKTKSYVEQILLDIENGTY